VQGANGTRGEQGRAQRDAGGCCLLVALLTDFSTCLVQFSASHLYLQLQYYRSLFDVERAIELVQIENQRRKLDTRANLPQLQAAVPSAHAHIYKLLHSHMIAVLRQSSYYWLPPSIFDTKIAAKR
jgi:hypothetical protein